MVIYSEFKIDTKRLRSKQVIKAAKMYVRHNRKVFDDNYMYSMLRFHVPVFDSCKYVKNPYHTILA